MANASAAMRLGRRVLRSEVRPLARVRGATRSASSGDDELAYRYKQVMPPTVPTTADGVLTFWFGPNELKDLGKGLTATTTLELAAVFNDTAYLEEKWKLWFFGGDAGFDLTQKKCADLIRAAGNAELMGTEWESPRGVLAQILLVDQFSRACWRGRAEAFAYDERGERLAELMVAEGWYDAELTPVERFFVTLPLQHSEDMRLQALGVELADRVVGEVEAEGKAGQELKAFFDGLVGYPDQHFDCIERFGRFPHRNKCLGRESTPQELAWLNSTERPGWASSQDCAVLRYWDGRGLGDQVRFVLEYTGHPYDEVHVKSRQEFLSLRGDYGSTAQEVDGELKASPIKLMFGQVPLLEMDGVNVVQTRAIVQTLARRYGLYGETPVEAAKVDMLINGIMDARQPLLVARFSDDPTESLAAFSKGPLPKILLQLEAVLEENEGAGAVTYLAGGAGPTVADVLLLEFVEYACDELGRSADHIVCSGQHQRIVALLNKVGEHPRMADFLSSERRKPVPSRTFVNNVCEILDIPVPKWASPIWSSMRDPDMARVVGGKDMSAMRDLGSK